jgi:SOS-response transcriptional repressor LexA
MNKGASRREKILDFMREYLFREGIYPSVREVAEGLETTPSNVQYHLYQLQKEGLVTHSQRTARSWRLTSPE